MRDLIRVYGTFTYIRNQLKSTISYLEIAIQMCFVVLFHYSSISMAAFKEGEQIQMGDDKVFIRYNYN